MYFWFRSSAGNSRDIRSLYGPTTATCSLPSGALLGLRIAHPEPAVACTCPPALLEPVLVCYKPLMRKWMRGRIKRRKTNSPKENQPAEAAQAPLQPAYFDAAEAAKDNATELEPQAQSEPQAEPTPDVDTSPAAVQPSAKRAPGESDGPPRRRRRRGRGGRGRSQSPVQGAQQAVPQSAPAPAESSEGEPTTPPSSTAQVASQTPKGIVVLAIGL